MLLDAARRTDALMRHLAPAQVVDAWAVESWPEEGDDILRGALHAMLDRLGYSADLRLLRQSATEERYTFILLSFLLDGIKEWVVDAGDPRVVSAEASWLFRALEQAGMLDFALDQATACLGRRLAAERAGAGPL